LACAGHRRGEVQGSLDGAQEVVGNGPQKRLELGLVEEPDLGRFGWLGLLGELGGVGTAPAAILAEREDRVQRADVVEDALGRPAFTALGGHERLDVAALYGFERASIEERPDVLTQMRPHGLQVGALAPERL
jgi:hypothetical protein